jgi:lactoylglutathione lyase
MTRLAYVSLHVHNLGDSLSFYATYLGLPILQNDDLGVILRAGDVEVHLHKSNSDHSVDNAEMTFDVEDADAVVASLRERGISVVDEVVDREWGDRDGAVEDPDGNTVYLRSRDAPT